MGCDCKETRRALAKLAQLGGGPAHAVHLQVFRGLSRAHRSGQLAQLAGGGLGSLEAGAWFPDRGDIDAETEAFDGRLNAWLLDYETAANRLPAALVQQVDDYVQRWRDLRSSFYVFGKVRADAVMGLEAEFNRLRDQVAAAGVGSAINPATVTVDGLQVRADQVPPGSSTLDRVERIAMWAAILVGGAAVLKVSSDLGLFKKLGGLARASNPAPRRNPRRRVRRAA